MSLKAVFAAILTLFVFSNHIAAKQITWIDQEITWNGHGTPRNSVDGPDNMMSPDNYKEGEWYMRFEVKEKPSDKKCTFQLCMWQDSWSKETCSGCVTFTKAGVYWDDMGKPSSWWKKSGGPDWTRKFQAVGIMLKQNSCGDMLLTDKACGSHCYPGNDLEQHVPIVYYMTVVAVAKGSTLQVPAEWTDCPWGQATNISIGDVEMRGKTRNELTVLQAAQAGAGSFSIAVRDNESYVFSLISTSGKTAVSRSGFGPAAFTYDRSTLAPGVYLLNASTAGCQLSRIFMLH